MRYLMAKKPHERPTVKMPKQGPPDRPTIKMPIPDLEKLKEQSKNAR